MTDIASAFIRPPKINRPVPNFTAATARAALEVGINAKPEEALHTPQDIAAFVTRKAILAHVKSPNKNIQLVPASTLVGIKPAVVTDHKADKIADKHQIDNPSARFAGAIFGAHMNAAPLLVCEEPPSQDNNKTDDSVRFSVTVPYADENRNVRYMQFVIARTEQDFPHKADRTEKDIATVLAGKFKIITAYPLDLEVCARRMVPLVTLYPNATQKYKQLLPDAEKDRAVLNERILFKGLRGIASLSSAQTKHYFGAIAPQTFMQIEENNTLVVKGDLPPKITAMMVACLRGQGFLGSVASLKEGLPKGAYNEDGIAPTIEINTQEVLAAAARVKDTVR